MTPQEALSILDQISRLAGITYDAQLQRCKAIDVLRSAVEPPKAGSETITADAAELGA